MARDRDRQGLLNQRQPAARRTVSLAPLVVRRQVEVEAVQHLVVAVAELGRTVDIVVAGGREMGRQPRALEFDTRSDGVESVVDHAEVRLVGIELLDLLDVDAEHQLVTRLKALQIQGQQGLTVGDGGHHARLWIARRE